MCDKICVTAVSDITVWKVHSSLREIDNLVPISKP